MINEKIKVDYYIRKDNGDIFFDYKKFAELAGNSSVDIIDVTEEFTSFTDEGKVIEPQRSKYELVNREAEYKLQELLDLRTQTVVDLPRAIELAETINEAFKIKNHRPFMEYNRLEEGDFSDDKTPGWVTIKIKVNHSNWHGNDDLFETDSAYYYQVPVEVGKEAKELQAICRKHKGDSTFDFWKCDYYQRKVKVSDNFND